MLFSFGSVMIGLTVFYLIIKKLLVRKLKKLFSKNAIAVISIDGVLAYSNDKESKHRQIHELLEEVKFLNPRAVILRVNSPGGTPAASQELFFTLLRLREKGIKVIILMEDVAASGGLYICMAADYIVAKPATITGSIGVIMQGYDISKILNALNIRVQTIKSGQFKDIMSPAREMTDQEKQLLQDLIGNTYGQFVDTIATARGLDVEKIKSFADGRILTGSQAYDLGLVDGLGGFYEAVEATKKIADITTVPLILNLEPKESFMGRFGKMGKRFGFSTMADVLKNLSLPNIPLWLMRI